MAFCPQVSVDRDPSTLLRHTDTEQPDPPRLHTSCSALSTLDDRAMLVLSKSPSTEHAAAVQPALCGRIHCHSKRIDTAVSASLHRARQRSVKPAQALRYIVRVPWSSHTIAASPDPSGEPLPIRDKRMRPSSLAASSTAQDPQSSQLIVASLTVTRAASSRGIARPQRQKHPLPRVSCSVSEYARCRPSKLAAPTWHPQTYWRASVNPRRAQSSLRHALRPLRPSST